MQWKVSVSVTLACVVFAGALAGEEAESRQRSRDGGTIKVFILAGDENVLEQGVIEGRTDGTHDDIYPNATRTEGENKKHATAAVYRGAWSGDADYGALTAVASGEVELGEQRSRQAQAGRRGRVDLPMTPFPDLAQKPGHTTVVRGYVSVPRNGRYEFRPGDGEGAFNVTTVEGGEVYRRDVGDVEARVTLVDLDAGKRYAFETVFFKQPSHAFRVSLTNTPGALTTVVAENPEYAFLRDVSGEWVSRSDVVLYDAHPIHNNTRASGHFLQVGDVAYGGTRVVNAIGPELMLGHLLGNHFDEPVLLLRFGTRHRTWFLRGSRSLGHDYLPPSSGGTADHEGSWDVIHFNFGVWDAQYREQDSRFYKGRHTTSVSEYEQNLRTLVARMKQTGATLIFATTTPVGKGEPGRENADVQAFNAVAQKVMKENDVIVNDLHAETLRQGYPRTDNVHSVGNLAPKVTETILAALAEREQLTRPLPRVLLIGDSITGSYEKQVTADLDGKAFVCKNPGNAEHTWTGLQRIDSWLDLGQYLLNGQEYLELVSSVRDAMANMERVFPEYKGQEVELAGLVWFQGIKDSQSVAMTAAYEKNLANLIRDLRREFEAPKLPVVVAAIGFGGRDMSGRVLEIHNAQMAVGNAEKYREFAEHIACVDTAPFYRPAELSPGGHATCYNGNAETFLDIGSAVGQAMLRLCTRVGESGPAGAR
jgi:hypothetical protein